MLPSKLQQRIQNDPIDIFYDKILGCSYYDIQEEITRSVFKHQRTTVRSCHSSGKSYTAAKIALAFLFAYKDSIVLTTAPVWRQVEDVMWREIHQTFNKSKIKLGGEMLKTRYELDSKWYAKGFSSDKADNVQGYHAEHILIIVDEPPGVKSDVMTAIESILTSKNVKLLLIGNPTCGSGFFYNSHFGKNAGSYNKIKISVFDTPNFRANEIYTMNDLKKFTSKEQLMALELPYPQLVTPLWAWERMHDWGEESPVFCARVLAEFPAESEYTLISLLNVEQAVERQYTDADRLHWPRGKTIGIDVARYGSNSTVFAAMQHKEMLDMDWHTGKDTMMTCGKAIDMFNRLGMDKGQDSFVVDDTGVGGGVSDRLAEQGYNVLPVNFGSSSSDERFFNLKAEIFAHLKDMFMKGDISILDEGKLVSQLPTIEYEITSNGKLKIVSKEKMTAKGIESPDFADALALACHGGYREHGNFVISDKSPTMAGNLLNQTF
jgi:phage terminase large subunit